MYSELVEKYKQPVFHGYLSSKFPGRNEPTMYPYLNHYVKYDHKLAFFFGFFKGMQERSANIVSGKWIKIGGVYGPIPKGTSREGWKGSEEVVKITSKASRMSSKSLK